MGITAGLNVASTADLLAIAAIELGCASSSAITAHTMTRTPSMTRTGPSDAVGLVTL
jgi:hypothetical protein